MKLFSLNELIVVVPCFPYSVCKCDRIEKNRKDNGFEPVWSRCMWAFDRPFVLLKTEIQVMRVLSL